MDVEVPFESRYKMSSKINSTKDLILNLCYAKGIKGQYGEPVVGKVRLMKMVFLFEKEIRTIFNKDKNLKSDILQDFKAYDFGPYSDKVYDALEFLVNLGFLMVSKVNSSDADTEFNESKHWSARKSLTGDSEGPDFPEKFCITELGKKFVKAGRAGGELSTEQEKVLSDFKARCTDIELKSLLRYVYTKYPEFTTKSKIRDEILA
jgi:uncharacterized protein YwgA